MSMLLTIIVLNLSNKKLNYWEPLKSMVRKKSSETKELCH